MSYDLSKVSAPRLAHIVKGDKGYGFNLHGDKNQPGQTISAVDKDSPAELGGLKEGDRVIEVNHENVETKAHGDVVALIKKMPNETTLLVADKDTLAYLKAHNRPCTADLANLSSVIPTESEPPSQPLTNGTTSTETVEEKITESAPAAVEESSPPPPEPTENDKTDDQEPATDTTPEEVKQLNDVLDEQEKQPEQQPEAPAEPEQPSEPEKPKEPDVLDVKEAMNRARPQGKRNPRNAAKASGEDWTAKVGQMNKF